MQPLTPVSEVSEPPESPSPYMESGLEAFPVEDDGPVDEVEEVEPPPAAVPFSRLFACADWFDWFLMLIGALAAAAHGMALVIYLHYFGKSINLLSPRNLHHSTPDEIFDQFKQVSYRASFMELDFHCFTFSIVDSTSGLFLNFDYFHILTF